MSLIRYNLENSLNWTAVINVWIAVGCILGFESWSWLGLWPFGVTMSFIFLTHGPVSQTLWTRPISWFWLHNQCLNKLLILMLVILFINLYYIWFKTYKIFFKWLCKMNIDSVVNDFGNVASFGLLERQQKWICEIF